MRTREPECLAGRQQSKVYQSPQEARIVHTKERVLQAQKRVSLRSGHFASMFTIEKSEIEVE